MPSSPSSRPSQTISQDRRTISRRGFGRLTDADLGYLVGLILDGRESLGCAPPEYIEIFLRRVAERLGNRPAEEIVTHYAEEGECEFPVDGSSRPGN